MPAAKPTTESDKVGGVSSEAVRKATGRTWKQWLSALDAAGCREKSHQQIVAAVKRIDTSVSGWWQQMITVGYEQARGLRVKHEKPGGFEISVSRTLNVPVSQAYRAFSDSRTRRKWLDEEFRIRTSTKDRSMRIDWSDGSTRVNLNFTEKGPGRCQISAQHVKLTSAGAAERAKAAWRKRLDALKAMVESNAAK